MSAWLALVLAWVTVESTPAHACQCRESSREEAFGVYDAVFTGTVTEVTEGEGGLGADLATVRVETVYKGDIPGTVEVNSGGGMCGGRFQVGDHELFYASGNVGGLSSGGSCSPNEPVSRASLPPPGSPQATTARRQQLAVVALVLAGAIGAVVLRRRSVGGEDPAEP